MKNHTATGADATLTGPLSYDQTSPQCNNLHPHFAPLFSKMNKQVHIPGVVEHGTCAVHITAARGASKQEIMSRTPHHITSRTAIIDNNSRLRPYPDLTRPRVFVCMRACVTYSGLIWLCTTNWLCTGSPVWPLEQLPLSNSPVINN